VITKSYPVPADMPAKIAELTAQGLVISNQTDRSGELKHGSYDFTYEIQDGKILVSEVKKPGFVPDALVWKQIDKFFGGAA
jgi:hypothetical protein